MHRRQFLALGATVSAGLLFDARASAARSAASGRFVWINLRGALDGLHTVLPVSDRDMGAGRESLLKPVEARLLPLDNGFALHPELKTLPHGPGCRRHRSSGAAR